MVQNSIRLHPEDNIEIALRDLAIGDVLSESDVAVKEAIGRGHKIATTRIATGQNVIRYGQIIGQAKADIEPGAHIHVHNLGMGEHTQDYAFASRNTPCPRSMKTGPSWASTVRTVVLAPATISAS